MGFKVCKGSHRSGIDSGESAGDSIFDWILFSEILSWYQIIGGVFILGGIYLAASHEVPAGNI